MAKALVIVESPAKAKTINKYLGKQYIVKASLGHIKDLPKRDLAVDVDHDFEPRYEVIEGKKKLIGELKAAAKKVKEIYLAADPDREGEAICYHLQEELGDKKNGPRFYRVMFNEITKKAVQKAYIEVSEDGTEPAAAAPKKKHAKKPLVFRADRPFIFLIEDKRTGLILFMGRVDDPSLAV